MRHDAAPQPIYVHVGTQTAAPVIEDVASGLANNFVASRLVIEYVAPVSVNTLQEPPETVEMVSFAPQVQIQQQTVEHVPQNFPVTVETANFTPIPVIEHVT